jgi:hypothetical protein
VFPGEIARLVRSSVVRLTQLDSLGLSFQIAVPLRDLFDGYRRVQLLTLPAHAGSSQSVLASRRRAPRQVPNGRLA